MKDGDYSSCLLEEHIIREARYPAIEEFHLLTLRGIQGKFVDCVYNSDINS